MIDADTFKARSLGVPLMLLGNDELLRVGDYYYLRKKNDDGTMIGKINPLQTVGSISFIISV